MKKTSLLLTIAVAFQMLMTSCGYNDMVAKREGVDKAWANVQSAYQRRMDLIPNLVSTVKGEASFEQETLTKVVEARASATQMKIDASSATPEQMMQWQQAQGQLGSALSRLMQITENYPNLQANQGFRDLRDQLEGTENRINTERNRFNEVVAEYNTLIKSIPQNIYAGWFGFTARTPFQADAAAATAPKVDFGTEKK
ncbi:MAG: LemA family protein [Chitinophagales bacterium]|nr:LemA family protein [Chitinophagales bacterium]